MTNRSPSQYINDVEPNWIIRFEEAHVLLGTRVPCFEMGHPVLLGQALFGHVLSLEVEENESAKKQREASAQADDQGGVEFCFDGETGSFFGGGCGEFDGGFGEERG